MRHFGCVSHENASRPVDRISHENAECQLSPRDYTRTLIESNTPEGMVLTVPVIGGSSMVKKGKVAEFRISDHGDWTRIHLGALDAAYGREPFFQHLFPILEEEYPKDSDTPERLMAFNQTLWQKMKGFIRVDEVMSEWSAVSETELRRYASFRDRMMQRIDPRHSFVEPLFRFGPDAVFLLF